MDSQLSSMVGGMGLQALRSDDEHTGRVTEPGGDTRAFVLRVRWREVNRGPAPLPARHDTRDLDPLQSGPSFPL